MCQHVLEPAVWGADTTIRKPQTFAHDDDVPTISSAPKLTSLPFRFSTDAHVPARARSEGNESKQSPFWRLGCGRESKGAQSVLGRTCSLTPLESWPRIDGFQSTCQSSTKYLACKGIHISIKYSDCTTSKKAVPQRNAFGRTAWSRSFGPAKSLKFEAEFTRCGFSRRRTFLWVRLLTATSSATYRSASTAYAAPQNFMKCTRSGF